MQSEYVLVLTTTSSEEEAARLARGLVEAHLAACVQIDPLRSIYHWNGKLHDEPEWRLTIKTRASRYADVEHFIKANHAYQTPEVVRIDIAGGSEQYLSWLGSCVAPPTA